VVNVHVLDGERFAEQSPTVLFPAHTGPITTISCLTPLGVPRGTETVIT
jgi:hypothetical protein